MSPADQDEIVKLHNNLRITVQPTDRKLVKMVIILFVTSHTSSLTVAVCCREKLYKSKCKKPWTKVTNFWYDEVKDLFEGLGTVTGELVGCGRSYCANSEYKYFYVCLFCPQGLCRNKDVASWCLASCKCTTEII
uniref:SCP domain-containing protein n=1 Tax=Monopterus albus TaxID=43700 RepID=A0A3Q3KG92_MONAL